MTSSNPAVGAARPRPLLMVPLRRCGSHALRLRLNASPDFHSPYPLHIVDFMPLLPAYGDLADDASYFQLVVDIVGLQAASMVKWPGMAFDPVQVFDAVKNDPRSVHRIVWELLLQAGERHHARVVMDKSLDSVHYAPELMRLFPDMLFLHVVRDPRAQVASMNRSIIHEFDSTLNALCWARAQRAGLALAQSHPQRVLTLRFEDFLAHEEPTLRRICDFLALDFLPEMLDVTGSKEARDLAAMSDLWSSNSCAPIAANKDKFKQQLSMDEIESIESLTGDLMRHFGYELMTPARTPSPDAAVLERCAQRSEERRLAAWRQLQSSNFKDYALRRFRADYLAGLRARRSPQEAAG